MHTTTSINNQKSVIIRGLTYKVGSYISFHKELFYFYRHGMGIVQEVRPVNRYKEVHLLGTDIPYEIMQIDTIHLANATVRIPVITFKVSVPQITLQSLKISKGKAQERILQISGTDFISLNSKPVYIKETKQIINKLRSIK